MNAAFAASLVLASSTVFTSAQAESTPWLIRAGLSDVVPRGKASATAAGDVDVDDRYGPTVDISYYVTPTWAIDVLGGLPFKHDIRIDGAIAAETQHLPPVVSLQYHFAPAAAVHPYVGAGFNYTWFFDEKLKYSDADLHLDGSFGLAAQLGVDWKITDRWLAGVDVRWVDIDTDASVNGGDIGTVHIDPFVYSLTFGYRF